jgi:hypothetical protein
MIERVANQNPILMGIFWLRIDKLVSFFACSYCKIMTHIFFSYKQREDKMLLHEIIEPLFSSLIITLDMITSFVRCMIIFC